MAIHNQTDAVWRYVAETSWGTTPTDPTLKAIEVLPGSGIQPDITKQNSDGMRGDALTRNQYMVAKGATGSLQMELRPSAPIYAFTRAVLRSDDYTTNGEATATNTNSSGSTFDITISGGSDNWVTDFGAAVGAFVRIDETASGDFNGYGTWRIVSISTESSTNDTITVTGNGAVSVSATSPGVTVDIYVDYAECGTTDTSFTFEQEWDSDYMAYTGCRFQQMDLNIPQTGVATVGYSFIADDFNSSGVTLGGGSRGTTYSSAGAYHNNNISWYMEEGGSSSSAHISDFSMTVTNGYRYQRAASSGLTSANIQSGRFAVTGTMNVYFEDTTLLNKALNHTVSSLVLQISNAASSSVDCGIYIPRVYYQVPEFPTAGFDTDSVVTLPFEGYADNYGDILSISFTGALS